jgi:prepilin-type N-terminal cleavage/methylation domain-containing protein
MKMRGFTIVELLVVIVVIGILAAIVVVSYNGVVEDTAGSLQVKHVVLALGVGVAEGEAWHAVAQVVALGL